MNTKLYKYIIAFVLTFMALPMKGQDFLNVYFKDGTFRIFHFDNVKSLFISQYDANGIQHADYDYQHITTSNNEFVYLLTEIDSISFTKYNKEVVEENLVEAMDVVTTELFNQGDMIDAEKLTENLRNSKAIEDAWIEGNFLHVKVSEWEKMSFMLSQENAIKGDEIEEEINNTRTAVNDFLNNLNTSNRPESARLKVAIANVHHDDLTNWWKKLKKNDIEPLYNKMEAFEEKEGITSEYFPMPTLEFFSSDMYNYDVVLLCTHGGYPWGNKGHAILTGQYLGKYNGKLSPTDPSNQSEDVIQAKQNFENIFKDPRYKRDDIELLWMPEERKNDWGITKDYKVAYPIIVESFFENSEIGKFKNPNSILYNTACHTLEGNDDFADKLFNNRNLGTYLGYTHSNSYGIKAGTVFLESILNGASVDKAYNDLANYKITSKIDLTGTYKEEFHYKNGKYDHTAKLEIRKNDELDYDFSELYLFPTNTNEIDQETAKAQFISVNYVEVEGLATILDFENTNSLKCGFEYGGTYDSSWTRVFSTDKESLSKTIDRGNILFKAQLKNLDLDKEYKYRAFTYDGKNYNYGDICTFKTPADIPSEAVDLGLPSGTLWAKWNMGATAPEEYGDYYAWGETETKKGYGWYNYEHCDGTDDTCHDIGAEISGTIYDVAHVKWGGDWQLPTSKQIDELVKYCQHKVTTSKGVKGTLVTGPNGNTIFLPCAGFMSGTKLYGPGKYGLYKSGTRDGGDFRESWLLNADADGFVRIGIWNSTGHSVRPVISGK